jgi:16S rRNA processing protein RimM
MTRPRVEWLSAGRVGRPHGLDGSFHVTRPRPALLTLGITLRVAGAEAEIVRRSGTHERPVLRLAGHDGRAAAEQLRGEDLLVQRAHAPALGDDEWYAEDLQGCRVVDGAVEIGVVAALLALPSCEALEVERPGSERLLVPLVHDAVRSVDVAAGVIDIDLTFLGDEPQDAPGAGATSGRERRR